VAHDLRTPLAALRSQMEAMTDGVLPVTSGRLGRAQAELSRVEALVSDLGELSRIESPGMRPVLAAVEASSFAEDLYQRFVAEARRLGIAFDRSADPGLWFRADKHLLMRAATNVVQNALQHAGNGGRVSIGITRTRATSGRAVAIGVENTGSVPEEEIPRVFDRLYRGEGARHTPGSGLGLTIAKAVVDLHGGTIGIANTTKGTVVVEIRLPEERTATTP
jgi:two-component system sensor histidine kinase BaeS